MRFILFLILSIHVFAAEETKEGTAAEGPAAKVYHKILGGRAVGVVTLDVLNSACNRCDPGEWDYDPWDICTRTTLVHVAESAFLLNVDKHDFLTFGMGYMGDYIKALKYFVARITVLTGDPEIKDDFVDRLEEVDLFVEGIIGKDLPEIIEKIRVQYSKTQLIDSLNIDRIIKNDIYVPPSGNLAVLQYINERGGDNYFEHIETDSSQMSCWANVMGLSREQASSYLNEQRHLIRIGKDGRLYSVCHYLDASGESPQELAVTGKAAHVVVLLALGVILDRTVKVYERKSDLSRQLSYVAGTEFEDANPIHVLHVINHYSLLKPVVKPTHNLSTNTLPAGIDLDLILKHGVLKGFWHGFGLDLEKYKRGKGSFLKDLEHAPINQVVLNEKLKEAHEAATQMENGGNISKEDFNKLRGIEGSKSILNSLEIDSWSMLDEAAAKNNMTSYDIFKGNLAHAANQKKIIEDVRRCLGLSTEGSDDSKQEEETKQEQAEPVVEGTVRSEAQVVPILDADQYASLDREKLEKILQDVSINDFTDLSCEKLNEYLKVFPTIIAEVMNLLPSPTAAGTGSGSGSGAGSGASPTLTQEMLTTYSPQINTHHGEAYQLAIRPLTDLGVSCDSSKLLNTLEILDEDNKRAVIEAVLEIIYIINPALKS